MKELSLNILDIAENSVKAKATLTQILITEDAETIKIEIKDDGCGMTEEILKQVTNPFYTTRTTRKVGMGLPLLQMEAEQTGGYMTIQSKSESVEPKEVHGTEVTALFYKNSIDMTPLGDTVSSIITLVQGHPDTDFLFIHKVGEQEVSLDTRVVREAIGDVPINEFEVLQWMEDSLKEEYQAICDRYF